MEGLTPKGANDWPKDGEWPCQTEPAGMVPAPLVAFLYRLLRDGAVAPSDVEGHAIQAGKHREEVPSFTNPHLFAYALSLAGFLTHPEAVTLGLGAAEE